jgi:hypothetical protein
MEEAKPCRSCFARQKGASVVPPVNGGWAIQQSLHPDVTFCRRQQSWQVRRRGEARQRPRR